MSKEPIVGLLRSLGDIGEKMNDKSKNLWYFREMTFDTGLTYKFWNTNKDILINLETLIDGEVAYSIGEKGEVILHNLPSPPKILAPKPRKVEGSTRETYWEEKGDWDRFISGILERQYCISLAREFAVPLGRINDSNWKEVLDDTVKEGIRLHQAYGKIEL